MNSTEKLLNQLRKELLKTSQLVIKLELDKIKLLKLIKELQSS